MMGHPKQTIIKISTSDLSEDDHENRKRERETSADVLGDRHDELEKTPVDAEGVCPPKKRGKETEEDSETTTVRKNMEEMVCQDQTGGETEETQTDASTKNSKAEKDGKLPEEGTTPKTTSEKTAVHDIQMKSPQSSSKAAAEFIPSRRSNTESQSKIPPSSTTSSYTLPESSFSRSKEEALPSTTSGTTISNPFLKNVSRTDDDDEEDVDDAKNVKDAKDSQNTRTRENDDVREPSKKKYAFGQTLGPGAADIGRSNPAISSGPLITNTSSSSTSTTSTSTFGAQYAGVSFGSTAASGQSIFGSGQLGSAAASNASPFAALTASNGGTSALEQTSSVFGSGATTDLNEDDEDKEENSDEADEANNENDGAGSFFGSANQALVPEQEVITGEEDEETLHQVKGKLFAMENGEWRERGSGTLKLKISMKDERGNLIKDEKGKGKKSGRKPRLVMRTDAVLRLILNTPLFAGMAMRIVQEKFVIFGGVDKDGNPMSYGFRAPSSVAAADLCDAIDEALNNYL